MALSCSARSSFISLPCWISSVLNWSSTCESTWYFWRSFSSISPRSLLHRPSSSVNYCWLWESPPAPELSSEVEFVLPESSPILARSFCLRTSSLFSYSIYCCSRCFSALNVCSFPWLTLCSKSRILSNCCLLFNSID